jgi:hypothetical protein
MKLAVRTLAVEKQIHLRGSHDLNMGLCVNNDL